LGQVTLQKLPNSAAIADDEMRVEEHEMRIPPQVADRATGKMQAAKSAHVPPIVPAEKA
jgi:hypothetical protein